MVVGVGVDPDGLIWTASEVMVFERLDGLSVNDGVGFGAFGVGAERIMRGSRIFGVGRNDVHVGPERSALVRRRFSRGGDEMWRSHPWRGCGVRRNEVCVGPERSALVRRWVIRDGDVMWRSHPRS